MTAGELDIALKITELIAVVGGGAMIFLRLGRTAQKFDQHTETIGEIKIELKEMRVVITTLAVQDAKLQSMQQQLVLIEQRYEEIRHGEGMVFPFRNPFPTKD